MLRHRHGRAHSAFDSLVTVIGGIGPDGCRSTCETQDSSYFSDEAALQAALGSDEGQATSGDFQQIAPPGSRMFIATVDD